MKRKAAVWAAAPVRVWHRLQGPRFRGWFRMIGLVVLLTGCLWSVNALDLRLSELSLVFLLLNLLVLSPLLLVVAGATLGLTARALGVRIVLAKAVQTAALANVAELLPLPGGALVRGAALNRAGAGLADSALMIVSTSVLTLFMSVSLSAVALGLLGQTLGWWVAGIGATGVIMTLVWLSRRVRWRLLILIFAIRILTLGINIARLAVSFAAIGVAADLARASLFSVATSLGSTVAIVPAGFGVNEMIAAALATLVATPPAAAFLAVALNRALGLSAGAALGLLFGFFGAGQDD